MMACQKILTEALSGSRNDQVSHGHIDITITRCNDTCFNEFENVANVTMGQKLSQVKINHYFLASPSVKYALCLGDMWKLPRKCAKNVVIVENLMAAVPKISLRELFSFGLAYVQVTL